jgi:hypothetical protein
LGEDYKHSGHPSTGHTDENMEKICKNISTKTDEAPFQRSLKGWASYIMKYYEVKSFLIHILHQIIHGW